jgi:hypothetical protein
MPPDDLLVMLSNAMPRVYGQSIALGFQKKSSETLLTATSSTG